MDNQDISPGQDWKFAIQSAISTCNAAMIFLSSKSLSKTGYVQVEIAEFLEQFELIVERKLRRRQLTDNGNVEATGCDLREKNPPNGQHNLFERAAALSG
jgi:hypothetical protein